MKETEARLARTLQFAGLKTETEEGAKANHSAMLDKCERCLVAMDCECRDELITAIKNSRKSFDQFIKNCPRGWEGEDHGEIYLNLLTENTLIPEVSSETKTIESTLSPGISCDIQSPPEALRRVGPVRMSGRKLIDSSLIQMYLDHSGNPKKRYLNVPSSSNTNISEKTHQSEDIIYEQEKRADVTEFVHEFSE